MSTSTVMASTKRADSRRSRGFSFRSNKSSENKKQESSPKAVWPQNHAPALDTRLQSKVDPNRALYESQPMDEALTSQTSDFKAMRTMEHRDINGQVISEPDRSNPTRHRFERPLDTIRALEARIDRSYDTAATGDSPTNGPGDRRHSSFYGNRSTSGSRLGLDQYAPPPRPSSYRPPSMLERYGSPNRHPQHPGAYGVGRPHGEQPHWQGHPPRQHSVYPSPNHQNSYDTVPSAEGSYNTDPYGASTDPSSESSSIYRRTSGHRNDGIEQVQRDPSSQDLYALSNGKAHQGPMMNGQYGPAQQYPQSSVPRAEYNHPSGLQRSRLGSQAPFSNPPVESPKVPIRLGGASADPNQGNIDLGGKPDRRKSWLRRTLSRK